MTKLEKLTRCLKKGHIPEKNEDGAPVTALTRHSGRAHLTIVGFACARCGLFYRSKT